MMKYVSVKEMIAVEKAADSAGHSYQAMMEAAGKGLAQEIHNRYHHIPSRKVTGLIGSGNNGGDALVALDYLGSWGWKITAVIIKSRPVDDPLVTRVKKRGGGLLDWSAKKLDIDQVKDHLSGTDLIIDGVLGTGIKLPLREPIKTKLAQLKEIISSAEMDAIVIAVDCPSGVDCDTGEVSPSCLKADLTVTMAAVKKGILEFPAYNYIGELVLVEIGLPADLPEFKKISREVITKTWVDSIIPARPLNAHKGIFGTALIIAGSINYPGAAILAAEAAYRSGAGLVSLAVPDSIYQALIKRLPEVTWIKLEDEEGAISARALAQVKKSLKKPTALLIGPGLGSGKSTKEFLEGLLELKDLPPLVLDADGLRLAHMLEGWPDILPEGSVLTPHPGEMAALTDASTTRIQSDRVGYAEKFAREWDQIVVLKGAHTVIAEPGGETKIYEGGDPGLARAGSGDVLAGIIVGLMAQKVQAFDAAAGGVWIHGQAGKMAGEQIGNQASVLASDISDQISNILP